MLKSNVFGWLKSLYDPKVVRRVLADLMHYGIVGSIIAAAWPFFTSEPPLGIGVVLRAVVLTSIAGACLIAAALLEPREVEKPKGAQGPVDPETPSTDSSDEDITRPS